MSTYSSGHWVVCSTSSIYGFWLPIWYLQTLSLSLSLSSTNTVDWLHASNISIFQLAWLQFATLRKMRATESTLKMIWKLSVVAVILIFSMLVSTLIFYKKLPNNPRESKPTKHIPTENDIDCSYLHDIIRTRNELSLQLNNMRRLIGQMQCEVIVN